MVSFGDGGVGDGRAGNTYSKPLMVGSFVGAQLG